MNSETLMNLFTGTQHKNASVFLLTQNIYHKGKYSREININLNYLVIFRNPRDQLQIQVLARQMYPSNSKFFIDVFNVATKKPFGYLFFDLKQSTEIKNRIQTGILPYQKRIFYTEN